MAHDLGGGAAEIEIEVVDAPLADQSTHRFGDNHRVGAIELQRPRGFVGSERGQLPTLLAPFEQTAGVHHFAHVEPGPVAATEATEGAVGDTSHRCKHDGRVDRQGADGERALHEPSR